MPHRKLGKDVMRRLYEENLETAIDEIKKLSEALDRKIAASYQFNFLIVVKS